MMLTPETAIQTLEVIKTEEIKAPVDVVFESILAILGPESQMGHKAFPMTFEAWPGGRWFRDLGNNAGHLWGHVQVIKPPTLIEICGPMFMSYPAASHLQYRITADGPTSRLQLTHKAFGLIPKEHREGVNEGWANEVAEIRARAERLAKKK
ncbi:hypothetical protein Pan44_22690 [Caulifigura coniformis]|uniref:SRPBCC domain-containing protein n=1 Tax=Caulifigura coniformis TaxID=2527983 RepID=A0A517SDQ1_9PLAN|nr:SRPBCC domain-containing protein [Caulifigura coniformis]QDT54241.1 hypothetical protein Pan44_22690 [Caulifigura coniformis]